MTRNTRTWTSTLLPLALIASLGCLGAAGAGEDPEAASKPTKVKRLERVSGAKPRNILYILTDDHRYDAMGFMGHPWLETPNLDRLAKEGVHARNAFVTTALCSPSRASVLTGLYAHRHGVIDNINPMKPGLTFFPQYLQRAGYQTAFIGKWHMGGEGDEPKPGFDRWVSFRGQGTYLPSPSGLNVDGKRVKQKGYITDELTDYAVDWLKKRDQKKPFFLYLSHKAVHSDFRPADRHAGRYRDKPFSPPSTQADTPENYEGKPMWVRNQRNSHHGVDFPYHGDLDIAEYYRRYCETLLAVDESVGRLMEQLKAEGQLDSTLIVYMGDNGFMFGEHGLIDKRAAYEESMRVPLMLRCPELFKPATKMDAVVANIDIAPTLLEVAGLRAPAGLDGRSFLSQARGEDSEWRDYLLYEYFWERSYPQTPTMHALRGAQYKYIRYHGLWDTDELYDIQADPKETRNLIRLRPAIARDMNQRLFQALGDSDGMALPLLQDRGLGQQNLRKLGGPGAADFPPYIQRNKSAAE